MKSNLRNEIKSYIDCMLPIFQEAKEDFAKIVDFLKR